MIKEQKYDQSSSGGINATEQFTAQIARPLSELEEREVALSKAVDALHDSIERLHIKVSRTLLPEAPEPCGTAKGEVDPMRCQAATFLANQEQRIRDASRWLETIMGRCQL